VDALAVLGRNELLARDHQLSSGGLRYILH
jgi:hypothetical protein